jgi:hypothetical protein
LFRISEQEGELWGKIEPEKEIKKVVICYEEGEEENRERERN